MSGWCGVVSFRPKVVVVRFLDSSRLVSVWRITFEGLFSHGIVDISSSKNELGIEIPSSMCARS